MGGSGRTIGELLARRGVDSAERPALQAPGRAPLTYGALFEAVQRVGRTFREHGIGRADRVALVLPNGPEMAVAFLATAAAATCAPLNPAYREEELGFSFDDLRVKALLVGGEPSPAAWAAARRRSLPVFSWRTRESSPAGSGELRTDSTGRAPALPEEPGPEDAALVLHTSGTTARPKIVPLSHANLCASADNIRRTLALDPGDVCLNVMPLFHIHGLMAALLASLDAAASVVCTPGFRETGFAAWLRDFRPTWYTAVPTIHQAVLQACADDRAGLAGSRLRFVRSSSAALPARVLGELEELFGVPVIEAYGMTEASHQMASNPLLPGKQKIGSVGPAAGPEIAVIDASGRALPRGEAGELVIRGETVTAGYENAPEANAAGFVDGWLRTGDQGYVDDDGYVFLTGRLKEMINRGGEKIAPREVEEALLRHPGVAQATAFAVPHPRLGEDVAAAVVLRDGECASERDLRRVASERLAPFKVPRRVAIVTEIPKGATGKVQRTGLAAALGLAERSRPAATPRSPVEQRIADEWAALLGVESVGREDDFFELGGDSLAAVAMIERIAARFGFEVPVASFLEQPTIATLLELHAAAAADHGSGSGALIAMRSGGRERPVFCTTLHDGSLWRAGRLVRFLSADAAVYGFRPPAVDGRGPLPTIESLAARYLAAIDELQPHGPVRLIGPCFGGTVALEMAIQLERRGRPVELLALLNSFNRGWRAGLSTSMGQRLALRAQHLLARLRFHGERLRGRSPAARFAYLRARAALAGSHWAEEAGRLAFEIATRSGLARPRALRKVAYASRRAQRRYRPRAYSGPVLMVRAVAPIAGVYPLPLLGWAESLRGEVELLDLACEQLELWSDDDLLRTVARRIDEVLGAAERSAA